MKKSAGLSMERMYGRTNICWLLGDAIPEPIPAKIHRFGLLALDSIMGKSYGTGTLIVTIDGGRCQNLGACLPTVPQYKQDKAINTVDRC